jgi:5-bromo-4-chloroindolyl phosphate hydrolysis protein
MNEALRGALSGAAGVIAALGAYFPLQFTSLVSLGMGGVVLVGAYLVIPRKKGADEVVLDQASDITEADREGVLEHIDRLRSEILASKLAFERLGHPKTAEKIANVVLLVEAIANQVKRKPAEIPKVESFANYHLTRVVKLLAEYADIADGHQTDRIRTEIERLKGILDVVADGFEDFYEKLKLRRMDDLRIDGEAYMAVLNFEHGGTK